jgi:hypothetical protein
MHRDRINLPVLVALIIPEGSSHRIISILNKSQEKARMQAVNHHYFVR